MPDDNLQQPEVLAGEGTTSVTYATPLKRVWAWVGVVYMVIAVLLVTYGMATGHYLTGIAGLMVLPALAGVAASAVCVWAEQKERRTPVRAALLVLILLLCAGLATVGVLQGVPGLLTNFGG